MYLWELTNVMMGQTGKAWDRKPDLVPRAGRELASGHRCQENIQFRSESEHVIWAGHPESLWCRRRPVGSRERRVSEPWS